MPGDPSRNRVPTPTQARILEPSRRMYDGLHQSELAGPGGARGPGRSRFRSSPVNTEHAPPVGHDSIALNAEYAPAIEYYSIAINIRNLSNLPYVSWNRHGIRKTRPIGWRIGADFRRTIACIGCQSFRIAVATTECDWQPMNWVGSSECCNWQFDCNSHSHGAVLY